MYVRNSYALTLILFLTCENILLASFPSVSSLLAAMETDPEDVLISLGFCDDISSQVRRIPARFFMTPSQAKGIDVQKVLHQVMNHDSSVM